MDIQKLMQDAGEIFHKFAQILKQNKKAGCMYTNPEIDALCSRFGDLCTLWDGAFSLASTVDPDKATISAYSSFVMAAVCCHVDLELSITPKVHLMHKHVAHQMSALAGGLGGKREDWLERQH